MLKMVLLLLAISFITSLGAGFAWLLVWRFMKLTGWGVEIRKEYEEWRH